MKSHLLIGSCLLVLLTLAGCSRDDGAAPVAASARAPEKVVNVKVATVKRSDLAETFTLPGSLEAWQDLTLAAELAGAVRWTGPEEGARLAAGAEILRIDPETAKANLDQARADCDLLGKQLDRVRQLHGDGFASQQELDSAASSYAVAAAALQRSQVALAKSSISCPVPGILDRRLVERGEYVAEGTPVARVVQVDRLKVQIDLPEKDVPFVRVGQTVTVQPAVLNGTAPGARSGTIRHIAYNPDPATRTYRTTVEVANPAGDWRPGMIVRATFLRRTLDQVLAVPLYALLEREATRLVFVEEGGIARRREVTILAVVGQQAVIDTGLEGGERVIVSGQQLLADGAVVAVVAVEE
ncbi:multidrug efflux RND transporter periplasmic adaptor subunit MexV [Desulfuromonas carbonis]|uniref:efflux RND transporter periplasmic adaptor subunit n=1 Tax=Desulfuromonas sp. DDH964 TaxID=1823759 RepID=UPI00078DF4EF|nr:efflux RND transporter periplasmic adaptor subunit [Desulfuromonas sp. DDH964]AMV71784.1 RND family efflux pump membrane fusion protein [Desulfuromonas sp. DDH964]